MQDSYGQSKLSYFINSAARKIVTAFTTIPELGFVLVIVIGVIFLFLLAKLFIRLP